MISRSTDIKSALKSRQRGFLLNPSRFGGSGGPPATDPYFANVSFLLHGNGTNGSTTFVDSSTSAHTIGLGSGAGTSTISTAQNKYGGSSIRNLTNSYLLLPADATGLNFSGDFTFEFWVRFNTVPADIYFFDRDDNIGNTLRLELDAGLLNFRANGANVFTYSWAPSTGTWYHWALSRTGTAIKMYIQGAVAASNTYSSAINSGGQAIRLGNYGATPPANTIYGIDGWLDDVRITIGVGRYPAAFTPPTAQHPDS